MLALGSRLMQESLELPNADEAQDYIKQLSIVEAEQECAKHRIPTCRVKKITEAVMPDPRLPDAFFEAPEVHLKVE